MIGVLFTESDELSEFSPPFPAVVEQSPGQKGIDKGVDDQGKVFLILFADQEAQVVFNIIGKQDGGSDFAGAVANGAFFKDLDIHLGPDPLPGNLNQAELAGWQDGMFGAVAFHFIAQFLKQFSTVHPLGQVDKVDHDDASHIAQPQLPGYFGSCFEVDFQCVGLLVLVLIHPVAAVNINYMQRFGVFNDEVGSAFDGDNFAERVFNLFIHTVLIEEGICRYEFKVLPIGAIAE